MKKYYITIFALLSMMAVSCQKENFSEVNQVVSSDTAAYSVRYTIDGVSHYATFNDKAERLAFIRNLVALTREGHNICIGNGNTVSANATKEKVVFTTTSGDEATAWAAEMMEQGYDVFIEYDKETGIYTCTAIK